MIRSLFRLIGLIFLALAFIFLIYDGTRSIADQELRLTCLEQTWSDVHQASLAKAQPALESFMGGVIWKGVAKPVLNQPTWAALGVIGLVLLIVFRRRRPLIGYSR